MAETGDIRNNIHQVRGPQGQNVVLTPVKQGRAGLGLNSEEDITCCCILICSILGGTLLLIGFIFLVIILSVKVPEDPPPTNNMFIHYKNKQATSDFTLATKILLGIGGSFILLIIPLTHSMNKSHMKRAERFMYNGSGDERQSVLDDEGGFGEEVGPEAFERSYEMYNPEWPERRTPSRDYRVPDISRHQRVPAPEREVYHPSVRNNYPSQSYPAQVHGSNSSALYWRHNEPSYASPQRRLSNPVRGPFAMSAYDRGSPGLPNFEMGPYRSSPIGERSFSPSSDSTYVSHYSSTAEGSAAYRT